MTLDEAANQATECAIKQALLVPNKKENKMTTYIVYRRETWVQAVEVEAKSKEEALNLVYQDGGNMGYAPPEFLENDIRGSMDLSTVEETTDCKKLCQCTSCKCRR